MNNTSPSGPKINKVICEAIGCHSEADIEVHINIAKGIIPLFLCSNCKSKFHLDKGMPLNE